MNAPLAAGTFAIVLPAELPDKTFISAIVLASRHRPLPVWAGTATGLVVQAAIGVAAGRLLGILPHRAVEGVVAGLFLAGAAWLLLVPERAEEARGTAAAAERIEAASSWRVALMTFGIVALAEFGDLTQVIVANLTARSRDPLSVFVGAAAAFVVISAVGVAAGRTLTRYVPLSLVRRLSGAVLAGLGIWSAVSAAVG